MESFQITPIDRIRRAKSEINNVDEILKDISIPYEIAIEIRSSLNSARDCIENAIAEIEKEVPNS